ncbi:MAG: MG284/MPN403 family protein [Mycoplasmoidaceae bacterium]
MKDKIVLDVKEIFYKYRKNKLFLENYQVISNVMNMEIMAKDLENYQNYISLIDTVLDHLDEIDRQILKNIFIEQKEKYDLNYAESTYYWKLRRASNNFMEMLKW